MIGYDTDLVLWSEQQARLLRRLAHGEQSNGRPDRDNPDWNNIAEEIESLGKSDRRELRNRVVTILEHLIKLRASPASEPRAGWRRTVLEKKGQLAILLDDSPSLRRMLPDAIASGLPMARALALQGLAERGETPAADPAGFGFTPEDVLGPDADHAT